jgi:hypothetical protein
MDYPEEGILQMTQSIARNRMRARRHRDRALQMKSSDVDTDQPAGVKKARLLERKLFQAQRFVTCHKKQLSGGNTLK